VSSPLSDKSPDASEARLLARLLVSEIKLYNSDLFARGVRDGSLYHVLKKEIDRARSMYDSRIPLATRKVHDHFQEELVRVLANGNADLVKTQLHIKAICCPTTRYFGCLYGSFNPRRACSSES
jgi:hypothetical protein